MIENQGKEIFEFYTNAWKAYTDIFKYQSEQSMFISNPFEITPRMNYVIDNVMSSLEIYDAWLKGVNSVIEEGFEVSRKVLKGEKIETAGLSNRLKDAYDDIAKSVVKSAENTNFKGINQIDQAIKNALDFFVKEEKMLNTFADELLTIESEWLHLFKSSKGINADIDDETIMDDDYRKTIETYKKCLEHSSDILRLLAILQPLYKNMADEMIAWTKKMANISASWMEINLKPFSEMRRCTMEFYSFVEEALKEGNSIEEFYKKWVETMDKAKSIFINNPESYDIISDFITKNTEFIKSTMEMYRNSNSDSSSYPANGYPTSSEGSLHAEAA